MESETVTRQPWLGIELRHLAALSALAEEGSFRGAADSLGYVQSAISSQLAHLERLVGARLVNRQRGAGPISLTDAGEVVLSHAGDILSHFNAARADLENLKEGQAGRLRAGFCELGATRLLPRVVLALRRHAPRLSLDAALAMADENLRRRVESAELDAAVCTLPVPEDRFESMELLDDPYMLLVQAESVPARRGAPPSLSRLSKLPLIDHRGMRHVEGELGPQGFEPRYVFQAEVSAIHALVSEGVGAAILPRLAIDQDDESVVQFPLDALLPPRSLGVIWNRDRHAGAGLSELLDVIRRVCAEQGEWLDTSKPLSQAASSG